MMDGILVVNKEKGYTSHDVVAVLRRLLHVRKIGHTGTLDPMAEGVLPAAIGKGTGLIPLLPEKQKGYRAVMHLGMITDTQDITGNVEERRDVSVTEEQVREACAAFLGPQMQIPPMYSAIKQNGTRLYDLARQGVVVEREPRPVEFFEITVEKVELPLVYMDILCSKGTYIRTLCHDIGQRLGCGACIESLVRTRSGDFTLDKSYTLSQVEQAAAEGRAEELILTTEQVLSGHPAVRARREADRLLDNGNPVTAELMENREPLKEPVRMYDSTGRWIGLYQWKESREQYFPVRIFKND
ncbi:MAG: tRNA pseudouridine(55) synthase TruB [Blautia sp.]|nr:tRNA pseudouridine(55) synthase TruB [Blautia sp.]